MSIKGLIPSSLTVENGLTYAKVTIPLENQGLVFVRGLNYDTKQTRSNGAGKSSFADIFEHILFETTPRGLSKDAIIRSGSSEGYYAKLCLKTASGVYYVEQARNHSKHGTSLTISQQFEHGVEPISAPKNINKAKAQLQSILNMTRQQFHGYVYLCQGAGSPLVTGTGAEAAKYLSSTFGFDVYDSLRSKLKDVIDQLQASVAKAEVYTTALRDIDSKIAEFKNVEYTLEMEAALAGCIEFGQDQLEQLHNRRVILVRLHTVAERRAALQASIPATADIKSLMKSLEKREKLTAAFSNQLAELTSQKNMLEARSVSVTQLSAAEKTYEALVTNSPFSFPADADYTSIISDTNTRIQSTITIVSKGDDAVALETPRPDGYGDPETVQDHKDALEIYDEHVDDLRGLASQYAKLKDAIGSPVCLACGQTIPHDAGRAHQEQELAKALRAKKTLAVMTANKLAADTFLDACAEYETYQTKMQAVAASIAESGMETDGMDLKDLFLHFKKKNSVRDLQKFAAYATNLKSCLSEINMLKQSLAETSAGEDATSLDTRISDIKLKIASSAADIANIKKQMEVLEELAKLPVVDLQNVEDSNVDLESEISELKLALKETQALFAKFSTDSAIITDLMSRKTKTLEYLEQFKDDLRKLDWLKTLYKGLAKLKARKLHAVVQSIRDTLPLYIDDMFDGEDITFDINDDDPESILLWAVRPHPEKVNERTWIPVQGLSKGEGAGLRVSLLWTLKDIMQPEKSADMLILDEADDGLDETGLAAFCNLLEKMRHQYGTVFVISQRRELTGVRFDKIWTAVKRHGVTTLDIN